MDEVTFACVDPNMIDAVRTDVETSAEEQHVAGHYSIQRHRMRSAPLLVSSARHFQSRALVYINHESAAIEALRVGAAPRAISRPAPDLSSKRNDSGVSGSALRAWTTVLMDRAARALRRILNPWIEDRSARFEELAGIAQHNCKPMVQPGCSNNEIGL